MGECRVNRRRSGYFSAFAASDYRWLWIITALTNAGSWTFTLVTSWQVYAMTHSSSWAGAMMFATLAPNILGAPIAGVIADLSSRRYLMLVALLLQLATTLTLAGLSHFHAIGPSGLLMLSLVYGFAASALSVVLGSLLPSIVAPERLFNAYSLQAIAQRGTEFVGPAIASPLLAIFGPGAVYLFASVLSVVATVSVFYLAEKKRPASQRSAPDGRGLFAPLLDGFMYIRKAPTLGMLVSVVGWHCGLTMAYMGILSAIVKTDLNGSSGFYGTLMSTVGLGSILGTLLLAGVNQPQQRGRIYWLTAVLSGLSLGMLALSPSKVLAIVSILLVGSSQAVFMTLSLAYIQEMTTEQMRGRVTSVYLVLAAGVMSLANLGYGALSNFIDARWILIVTGLLFVAITALYTLFSDSFRSLSRSGAFSPRPSDGLHSVSTT